VCKYRCFSINLFDDFTVNLSGDVYEFAVILSIEMKDHDAFERDLVQLKVFYTDTRFLSNFKSFWSYVL
jgi:hypothetical protein